ncbi:MAG: hypothetical protein IPK80_36240 [Nannocystis sp.]|nr:hypothetical protein [Nannocystis sp.]
MEVENPARGTAAYAKLVAYVALVASAEGLKYYRDWAVVAGKVVREIPSGTGSSRTSPSTVPGMHPPGNAASCTCSAITSSTCSGEQPRRWDRGGGVLAG